MAAAGSVWNTNNWHWEEKSYTKWSAEFLKKAFQDLGVCVRVTDAYTTRVRLQDVAVSGEACASVRKGKSILAIDLNLSFIWSYERSADPDTKEFEPLLTGKVTAQDVSVDSIEDGDFQWICERGVDVSGALTEEDHDAIKRDISKNGKTEIAAVLKKYIEGLTAVEADAEKLEKDRQQRACEEATAAKALGDMGAAKEKIAAEQKELDLQRKLQNAENVPQKVDPSTTGTGSVWNANSYHWEEKPMTEWSLTALKQRLSQETFEILDKSTKVSFFNVKTEGEASTSIRKGKKISIFDLTASADWSATARDEDGNFLADSKGRFDLEDFCSESVEDYVVKFTGDGKVPPQQRIDKAIKQEMPKLMKPLLMKFVEDLRARG